MHLSSSTNHSKHLTAAAAADREATLALQLRNAPVCVAKVGVDELSRVLDGGEGVGIVVEQVGLLPTRLVRERLRAGDLQGQHALESLVSKGLICSKKRNGSGGSVMSTGV